MSGSVTIEDYDPQWPEQFERLRSRIAQSLGTLAASIEHVGSTAVPGLAAKPVIDIDVLLRSAADFPEAVRPLRKLGYQPQGDLGIPGREAFLALPTEVPHHLYVCLPGYPAFARHIAFRDHLRSHPEDARTYERLKRSLARQYHHDREAYTEAKTEFVEGVLRRTEARPKGTFPDEAS